LKYLVTSGCSFTETWPENPADGQTWANYLALMTGMKLHNVAMSGAGNHIISTNVIKQTEKLLESGISAEDICVVVQWSGIFRFDRVIEKSMASDWGADFGQRPVWIAAMATKEKRFEPPKNTKNDWIMCAGARTRGVWPQLLAMTSKEQAFLETLENILRVQWYMKSKNIRYKMFSGWDIFTDGTSGKKGHNIGDFTVNSGDQFSLDGNYNSKSNTLLKENCKWFGYLFDMIDWENYWTYNSDKIKFGGLTQWTIENTPKQLWFRAKGDHHPTNAGHRQFAKKILMEIINESV